MTDEEPTCSVIDCDSEPRHESNNTCEDHAYCCERCGNTSVKEQSLSQRPILCKECGWVPDRGGLKYLFEKNSHFEHWTLVTNTDEELVFHAPWNGGDWRFQARHDPLVDDWQINGYREDGFGLWNPGSVETWTEAVAFLLDTLGVAEDSMVRPTEHYKT